MNFYGTALQDRFVYEMLVGPDGLMDGKFIDIGCSHPSSNTLGLEEIGWTGTLIDRRPEVAEENPKRKNRYWIGDSVNYPWEERGCIDYLSLDVDAASLNTLKAIPMSLVNFRVITIEHDHYGFEDPSKSPRLEMREIIASYGYHLACSNVSDIINGKISPYEDWWVCPGLAKRAMRFHSDGLLFKDIFNL